MLLVVVTLVLLLKKVVYDLNLPIKKPELYNYSPHQKRMLLFDQVDNFNLDNSTLEASLTIKENSEFFNKNLNAVPTYISFEYMAQSIATLAGIGKTVINKEPKIGFIIGVREFISEQDGFNVGDNVKIKIKEIYRTDEVAVFEGESFVNGNLYTSATLNVVENSENILESWSNGN